MLTLDFLQAADGTPLTKRFRQLPSGGYEVDPYPLVRNVTSHREHISTPAQLHETLVRHALDNHCLLKGMLREPLENKSRAGMTSADEPTSWLLLDLDFDEGWPTVDAFLAALAPEFANVSYVFQHSASAGIKATPGLRGHIWIMLEQPTPPSVIKLWLKERNLAMGGLEPHFELSANGQTLKWPLDISTCQNDKLIYLSPPVCENFPDPLTERFVLRLKDRHTAAFPSLTKAPGAIEAEQQKRVEQLRDKQGLPKHKAKYKARGAYEVLTNPEKAVVTGVKQARGFVYLNLNGGDSWAYYFLEDKPDLVHNFKGEPAMRLQDIAPDFYRQFVETHTRTKHGDIKPLVFRDPRRDTYYNVVYAPDEDQFTLFARASSTQKLDDFMRQYGRAMPDPLEDWTVVFDPTTTRIIDVPEQWVNTFSPTPYIRALPRLPKVENIPRVIDKILDSLCVDDMQVKEHFLNWLAFILQTRQKAGTAWVFHGVSGTGKGILVERVLRPLFGDEHVLEYTTQNFEDTFNANLERACILWMDEFVVNSAKQATMVMNRLKNLITESRIPYRAMHQEAYNAESFINVLIATNHPDPVVLDPSDRRFNIAPAQELPLKITAAEIQELDEELGEFAAYLAHYAVDRDKVRQVLRNTARQNMISASQTSHERFFQAVRTGDLDYFMDFLRGHGSMVDSIFYLEFEQALIRWAAAAQQQKPADVTREELMAAFTYIIGTGITPAKFARMCSIHRLTNRPIRVGDVTVNGFSIPFAGTKERIAGLLERSNVKTLTRTEVA